MRISVSLRSAYPADDARRSARWMIERARAAWEAGLDALFVGDHHVTGPVAYYQNSPMLGRLLSEWGERACGALYLLPLWPPVLLAEQVGTLAAIAQGRFILSCAIGGGEAQFAALGASLRTRPSAFETNLGTIRRLLAGEDVDGVRVAPVPPEPVEVWIGGHVPAALDRAARLGDGWLAGPDPTDDEAARLAAGYLERCQVRGRVPSAVAIRRDVHVGADDEDAAAVAKPVLDRGYRGFDPAACVVGGPATVARRFAGYAAMGYTDVVVRHLADDQEQVLASFARLGDVRRTVAPA
ncbi:MAG: LLM class flavin-dependent oxidoreductase [Actinomycetota bacterium]|nr:LLM class flavin-dependent oxidoreductase [Actinomycetota bacterium]